MESIPGRRKKKKKEKGVNKGTEVSWRKEILSESCSMSKGWSQKEWEALQG